jgi:DNA-binding HxlR family transcriptional regulator
MHLAMKKKFLSLNERTTYHSLEDVVGCKWSAGVVAALAEGVSRPGELERYIPGISKKILNERLRKLLDYRLITRTELPGRVPHVEYELTGTGRELARVIGQLKQLDQTHREAQ